MELVTLVLRIVMLEFLGAAFKWAGNNLILKLRKQQAISFQEILRKSGSRKQVFLNGFSNSLIGLLILLAFGIFLVWADFD